MLVLTVSVTALLAVVPAASVTCTRYMPESATAVVPIEKVALVAPAPEIFV